MEAKHADTGAIFWLTPGGGIDDGETFQQAAARELWEETGIRAEVGPCVWLRRHRYTWADRLHDQYERYFVAHTDQTIIRPQMRDTYVVGHRWWSLDELTKSTATFTPRKLPALLPAVLRGDCPNAPIDCGA